MEEAINSHWILEEDEFKPSQIHHKETIFTIGNGYLCTRGAFEEGFPGDHRATFIHGVFDTAPIVFTELANAPDWLPLVIRLDGERFSMNRGTILEYRRSLNLYTGVLMRTVRWRSPEGKVATIAIERFASLADPHALFMRCRIIPEFNGSIEISGSLKGDMDNEGLAHWQWIDQGIRDHQVFLLNQTRKSGIQCASVMRMQAVVGNLQEETFCNVENMPTLVFKIVAEPGMPVIVDKYVGIATSRDTPDPVSKALAHVVGIVDWADALEKHRQAWKQEWDRVDVLIEGDDEAQIAIRFNLFQMLIAAPRQDERVNIGAKALSGFGYRGHCFWDTEIFMLPLFIYTSPPIARNLLNYRYHLLSAARENAQKNGWEGAQFPWESADTGEEVTPRWVPHFSDPSKLVRIWTGDIEIHISADVAWGAHHYWMVTGDDAWMIDCGAELILDTAKFWASRAEYNPEDDRYEYKDVIGPDEYHEHVDNNYYTNRMAQWNLETALKVLQWLEEKAPLKAQELIQRLDLTPERLAKWRDIVEKITLNVSPSGLIEQFDGYFQLEDVDLKALEPRSCSVQVLFGIEKTNKTQVLKQPDVLMAFHVLRGLYSDDQIRVNEEYYTPRTDHSYGSSLGPSIQAIIACKVGKINEAYEHFIRAVRADLRDVRGNAGDGIHAASAAGTWQAVVFGFAGLHISPDGWSVSPKLPSCWKRLKFKFFYRGELQVVDIPGEV